MYINCEGFSLDTVYLLVWFVEIWRYFSSLWDWGSLPIISVVFVTKIRTEISVLLGCYAAKIGSFLPTFRYKAFVQSSIVRPSKKKEPDRTSWPSKMRPIDCPETSIYAAQHPRKTKISFTPHWKPAITQDSSFFLVYRKTWR